MKAVSTLLLVFIVANCAMLTACRPTSEDAVPEADPDWKPLQSLDLRVELRNGVVCKDNSIEVDFALINVSTVPVELVDRWNSWGAYQWTFLVKDAAGTEYPLRNPQTNWYANYFTTFSISPGAEYVKRCRLSLSSPKLPDGSRVWVFTQLSDLGQAMGGKLDEKGRLVISINDDPPPRRSNTWIFPLTVTGKFSASRHMKTEWQSGTNWDGSESSRPLVIRRTPDGEEKLPVQ